VEGLRLMGQDGRRPPGISHPSRSLGPSGPGARPAEELPAWLSRLLLQRPRLRRWPHPALIHFPIVFMWSTTFFTLVYLLTGNRSFENTAFQCLGGGVLTTPSAILSGILAHRLNFSGENGTITLEKRLSWVLLTLALAAFVWRWQDPGVLADLKGLNLLYLAMVLALTPLVTITSYFGGMLTYPLEAGPPTGSGKEVS